MRIFHSSMFRFRIKVGIPTNVIVENSPPNLSIPMLTKVQTVYSIFLNDIFIYTLLYVKLEIKQRRIEK